jgi:flagellar biosynthesis/type III secretory pathway protein FliH
MESTRAETFMRTMAEVLRERGHQQGLAEGEARGEAKGLVKGEAKGLARALLRLLASKGVQVDDTAYQRIQSCMDMTTLERWLDRALSATQISEVLDGPAQ